MATHHLVLYFMCDSYMGCDQVRDSSSPSVPLILTDDRELRIVVFLLFRGCCTIKEQAIYRLCLFCAFLVFLDWLSLEELNPPNLRAFKHNEVQSAGRIRGYKWTGIGTPLRNRSLWHFQHDELQE